MGIGNIQDDASLTGGIKSEERFEKHEKTDGRSEFGKWKEEGRASLKMLFTLAWSPKTILHFEKARGKGGEKGPVITDAAASDMFGDL